MGEVNITTTSTQTEEESSSNDGYVLFVTLNQHPITPINFCFLLAQTLLAAVTVWLNGLVVDTMVRKGHAKEPADVLVTGLAMTDTLTGIIVLYNVVYSTLYFQNRTECLLRYSLAHSLLAVSDYYLLCLTIDRYLKITSPYRYNDVCGRWTAQVTLVVAGLLGVIVGFLPLFGWNQTQPPTAGNFTSSSNDHGDDHETICTYFGVMDDDYLRFYMVAINLPVLVMALLYFRLFLVSRKHAMAIASQKDSSKHKGSMMDHAWRYTKTVFTVVGIYALCWMPTGGVVILEVSGHLDNHSNFRKGDFILYTISIVFINSIINPIIYAFKLTPIRQRFRLVFTKVACCCQRCLSDSRESAGT